MTENVTPLPPCIGHPDERFVPEPAVFPYSAAEWAADNLPMRQAAALVGMRPAQVRSYVAIIDGTAESSTDLPVELNLITRDLRKLAEACEAAAGRLERAHGLASE